MIRDRAAPNIAIATLLLIILCLLSGRPQVFSDTKAYYVLGREVVGSLHLPSPIRQAHGGAPSIELLRGRALSARDAAAATRLAYTVSASRSPYWSALFYTAVAIGSGWFVVLLQALVSAVVLWIAARAFGVQAAYLPVVAGLALLTTLPVQVMFLMPDLFAGLGLLSALVLLVAREGTTRTERWTLWSVMAASALFHTSHLLVLGGLGVGVLLLAAVRRRASLRRPGLAMVAAALVGVAGALAFPAAVQLIRHEAIYAPPFLSARLIADGPGRRVLAHDCARGDAWGWCAYRDGALGDVNTILWDKTPGRASFQAADYAARVRIIREQPRFVLRVVGAYPGEMLAATLNNIAQLFVQYGSTEALADPTPRYRDSEFPAFARIVPGTTACIAGTASCASRLSVPLLDAVVGLTLLVALAIIAAALRFQPTRTAWGPAALFVGVALFANAAICGAISGNAERYQSRVLWLVPLLGFLIAAQWILRRHDRPLGTLASA